MTVSRVMVFALALTALVLAAPTGRAGPQPGFAVGPRPEWVVSAAPAPDQPGPGEAAANGLRDLVFEHQVRLGAHRSETYVRRVVQVTNESGLQAASQLNIEFDPSFQKLTIHQVIVRRAGQVLERLDRDAIHLVQREKDLDAQIYDGRLSAVLFLQDVRVGDIVESAFTISGDDPTLGGRYAGALLLGSVEPIGHLYIRVLVPRDRHVKFVPMGPALADGASVPAEHVTSTGTEYVWDRSDIKAYTPEADAPPSFEPLPWVEATEFADWQEVARLGAELFDVPVALGGQLKEWVHKTLDAALSPEEFVLRATRFVQDEIRYVAVEVGMSRRRPTDPEVVMRRRYGDCKDKAALLTSMLLLGRVSARPVLVSTNHGRSLDGWAASPLAFDHAIVRARLGDGDPLFIDPTLTLQGGGLERMQYSMFDRVLELDPATTALRKTKREPAEEPSPLVRDEFHVATPETSGPTLLDSTRVYRGFLADAMRATVRAMTKEQLRRANLNRYAQDYPGIVDVGDVEVTDDRDRNELSVVDHFAIPAFWQPGQAAPFLAQIHARVIDSFLDRPSTAERTAPLGLLYPFHARYEVEVLLPLDLPLKPETMGAETRSFRYTFTAFSEHKHLSYTFDLKNLAREVKVVDLAEHAARVDEVRATLLRNLTYRPAPADGPNWPIIALVVLAVPASAWGARRAYLYDPPAHEPKDADPRWPGLGGWLTVLGIYVVLLTLGTAYEVAKLAPVIASKARWATITADASSHSPMLGPLVAGEVLFEIALTAFGAMMVFAYFRRKRSFPLHFAAVSAARVALGLGDIVGASATAPGHDMRDAVSRTVGAFLWAVVWIAYLRASRRASATFVR